ncbi:MAG: phosphatidylinositol glycan class B [Myxococcota bacterium]
MHASGGLAQLSVPILDWVAKDQSSYSYSVEKYGWQQSTDPWKPDAGNGLTPEGHPLTTSDPNDASVPWTLELGKEWLESFPDPPEIVLIGNELDIAQQTHRDVHPEAVTYAEQRDRYLQWARMVKSVWPTVLTGGPASCCWHYYWNSEAGDTDRQANGDADFLPWFLEQIAAADTQADVRTLDYLDIHYYPEGVFNDDVDQETRSKRLRMTRSLWDPNFNDESWIGSAAHDAKHQPNPTRVMLIPRMRALIDKHYPGTRLAINEWNFGAEADVSGGLAVADVLGIFARERVDLATYWTAPAEGTAASAAFRLFRQHDAPFGHEYLPINNPEPNKLGVYAARDLEGYISIVAINKDPSKDLMLIVADAPSGAARIRRFGGITGNELINETPITFDGRILVPAYSAVFLAITPGAGLEDPKVSAPPPRYDPPEVSQGSCTAAPSPGQPSIVWLLLAAVLLLGRFHFLVWRFCCSIIVVSAKRSRRR